MIELFYKEIRYGLGLFIILGLGVLSFDLPANSMMVAVEAELGESALALPLGDDIYRSVKQIFWLVSSANCETAVNGNLFACRPPQIHLEEASGRLPPLPYETKVQIRTTPSCRGHIEAAVGSLHARLGRFTDHDEIDDFLRDEVLTFSQSQISILNQPQSYPFKNLRITPRTPEIFTGARFPEGCDISIEIEFNRIALKTRVESDTYLQNLKEQTDLMTQLSNSLLLLHESRTQQKVTRSLLESLQGLFIREETKMARIHRQWEALRGIAKAFETNVTKNKALASNSDLQALTGSMAAFSRVLNQATFRQELDPETLRDLISDVRARDVEFLEAQLDQFLDPKKLRSIQLKLVDFNIQVATTERSLETYFSECEYPRCCEDLEDLFFAELCGPHGVIDDIQHGIVQIAPRLDEALPRE